MLFKSNAMFSCNVFLNRSKKFPTILRRVPTTWSICSESRFFYFTYTTWPRWFGRCCKIELGIFVYYFPNKDEGIVITTIMAVLKFPRVRNDDGEYKSYTGCSRNYREYVKNQPTTNTKWRIFQREKYPETSFSRLRAPRAKVMIFKLQKIWTKGQF